MPRSASNDPVVAAQRQAIREKVPCPTCGAQLGARCTSDEGVPREANHTARWDAAGNNLDNVAWSAQRRRTGRTRRRKNTPGGW